MIRKTYMPDDTMNGQYRGLRVHPCSIKAYPYVSFRKWYLSDYNWFCAFRGLVSFCHPLERVDLTALSFYLNPRIKERVEQVEPTPFPGVQSKTSKKSQAKPQPTCEHVSKKANTCLLVNRQIFRVVCHAEEVDEYLPKCFWKACEGMQ